jgi:hypothetical protein
VAAFGSAVSGEHGLLLWSTSAFHRLDMEFIGMRCQTMQQASCIMLGVVALFSCSS